MRKFLLRLAGVLAVLIAGIYVFNASWRVAPPDNPEIRLIAHRGVHQQFDNNGLGKDGCSAARIETPTHSYFENTVPAMQAAFEAGADIVELDVHPTTDGQFAVIHDWTLDCHSEGKGVVREQAMSYLKTLDVAYGYTADGGKTFPFRGQGVGMMPELKEVLAAFPEGHFLINYKSNEAREGDMLADVLKAHPEWSQEVWGVYGGAPPSDRAKELLPQVASWSDKGMIRCLLQYEGLGWSGYVPDACRNTAVTIPINFVSWLWGWPNLFMQRMHDAGSIVVLLGPYEKGDSGSSGIDSPELLADVPEGFDGYIWTNRIEVIGPALADR